jgi:hypothetical protein
MSETAVTAIDAAVSHLSSAVAPLIAAHEESERAALEVRDAEVALVTKILEAVRPAVRALGSRPQVGDEYVVDGVQGEQPRAAWRGIVLTCAPKDAGPTRKKHHSHNDTDGSYVGYDAFLREDGSIVELSYSGHWSQWQHSRCSWEATERVLSVADFVDEYEPSRPEDLVKHLQEVVDAAGDRSKRTAAMSARAEKLRAVTALLGTKG